MSSSVRTFMPARLGAAVLFLGFAACQSLSPVPVSGHYEGNLIVRQQDKLVEFPVSAEIPDLHDGAATIPLKNIDGSARPTVTLSHVQSGSLDLALPESGAGERNLRKNSDCYSTQDAQGSVKLCPARDELVIEAYDAGGGALYSLTLDYFPNRAPVPLEPAKAYGLDEAMNRALAMDFGTRIEFQHVMQARHLAANAYLNLLPHVGANSILAIATAGSVVGLLGAVGDLAPFLLPDRWLQARQAGLASEAEQDALILMRGDAGVQLEGMAYAFARDRKIQTDYAAAITQVESLRQQVAAAEAGGHYPVGSADMLATLLIQLQSEADALDLSVDEEKIFLAQAMGFVNPEAVKDLTVPEEPTPIEAATALDTDPMLAEAQERSFELRQMDYLIQAAGYAKDATYFSWMDPSGDPTAELGFGLGESIALASSRVDELRVTRDQTASTLLQKIGTTVAEYNDSLDDHERSGRYFDLQQSRVQRLTAALQAGQQVDAFDLLSALREHLEAQLNLRNSETVYRISRAKLDRLLLRGYYSHLSYLPAPAGT